jgi:hypothetical protein
MSKAAILSANGQATAARAFCNVNGTAPPGFFNIGNGPIIGPKQ